MREAETSRSVDVSSDKLRESVEGNSEVSVKAEKMAK